MTKNINTAGRTLEVIRKELTEAVDNYNLSESSEERSKLEQTHKTLVDEWNQLSLLTTYASCMDDPNPLIAFGKAYVYPVIRVKDSKHQEVINGVKRSVSTRSVDDSERQMSLTKFVTWAREINKDLTADKLWIAKWGEARDEANAQWKRFFNSKGEETKMKVGAMKRKLQALFDAMVFIETAPGSGKNAIIADGDMAKYILGLSNLRQVDLKTKAQKVQNMPSKLWETLAMDVWNMVCEKKTYEVVYGDEQPEEAQAQPEAKTKEEAKA